MPFWVSDAGHHFLGMWDQTQTFRCQGEEVAAGKCAADMHGVLLDGYNVVCPRCGTSVFAITTHIVPGIAELVEIPF